MSTNFVSAWRRKRTRWFGTTALWCALLPGTATPAAAQGVLPATPCDAAAAEADLHFPSDMPLEDGTKAFSYTPDGPFVSTAGAAITITVALTFEPSEDATIKLFAIDEQCTGPSSSGTVFSSTFRKLPSARNTIVFDPTGEVGMNGEMQKATFLGTPRYVLIDVWDGVLPSARASHSYLIDLLDPKNPTPQR